MAHHRLVVDHSERGASLLEVIRESGVFAVEMNRLHTGDYLIDDSILVERKAYADFIGSLIDGRLFTQVARLAHSRYRSLLMIEGAVPSEVPDVHPHSLQGALVSIAAMWRLPVLHSAGADESCRLLRFLADQGGKSGETALPRYGRKPRRLATRRLFVLQGLPGVGPALARRLLAQLGSVERVMTADTVALETIRGIGPKKAVRIRELLTG
jgi:ERCC4-type nuclease